MRRWQRCREGLPPHPCHHQQIPSPATEPGFVMSGVMTMAQLITLKVSAELADEFEAHAHLLAPARIVRKDSESNPCWWTYTLDWPNAPDGAASVTPIWHASYQGDRATVRLHALEWYDAQGRPLPDPAAHVTAD